MNIAIQIGYNRFIVRGVSSNMVDILMKSIVTDYSYIGNKKYEFILNNTPSISIIAIEDIPTLTTSDLDEIRREAENGNQDTI